MRGKHKVMVFTVPTDKEVDLPEGWKPFGVVDATLYDTRIVARKWERTGE